MEKSRRSSLAFGVILIVIGAFFLAFQLMPGLREWVNWENAWPLIVVGVGVALFIGAIVGGESGMAVPATIVGGIGCLLWWQNATGNWDSWAYAWALIPGFVGVGIIISGLLGGQFRSALTGGGWLIVISLVLFFIFGSFFGGFDQLGAYWPVLLIGLGVLILLRPLFRARNQ
jgi:hypothetical protein